MLQRGLGPRDALMGARVPFPKPHGEEIPLARQDLHAVAGVPAYQEFCRRSRRHREYAGAAPLDTATALVRSPRPRPAPPPRPARRPSASRSDRAEASSHRQRASTRFPLS